MAQAKKKTATKTAKKGTQRQACRKVATKTRRQTADNRQGIIHVYIITALGMIAGILLCANAAMMIV